jgi:hypothetical protein
MNRFREAKAAWTLWNFLQDLEDLLWKIYEPDFLDFLLHDEDPDPIGWFTKPESAP